MSGLLFITAPSADTKAMNRALVHIRAFPNPTHLKLVLSDSLEDFKALAQGKGACDSPVTDPDLRPPITNAWAGASLSALETFVEAVWNTGSNAIAPKLYLVVDEEGLTGKTCIVAQRICSFEEKPSGECEAHLSGVHDYNRVRIPWDGAAVVFDNLMIANLGFEDYVEYDFDTDVNVCVDAPTADGQGRWWTADRDPSIKTTEDKQKEAELLARLEKEGLV
ncbi:hypothetical protein PG993_001241 [Apiospora rasikravindrae]|uniref:Uncharacterized protein n=1 Tax=Apiospora rasikravindrae TaxID=990691 RepID=A0ABR1UDP6_9PEZI